MAYQVMKNGEELENTTDISLQVTTGSYAEYMVLTVDENNVTSFGSEPLVVVPDRHRLVYELEKTAPKANWPYRDYSGTGFVELSKQLNRQVKVSVTVPEDRIYAIDFRYANGSGPINTENKVATRTLKKGNVFAGTIVMLQRGTDEWSNWGFSNAVEVPLQQGCHSVSLTFEPANENMHGDVNQAMVDYMRVIKIK